MSWSGTPNESSGGRRKRQRRGPRWVTDHARDVAGRQQADHRAERLADPSRRRNPQARQPEPPRYQDPPRRAARPAYGDEPRYRDDSHRDEPRYRDDARRTDPRREAPRRDDRRRDEQRYSDESRHRDEPRRRDTRRDAPRHRDEPRYPDEPRYRDEPYRDRPRYGRDDRYEDRYDGGRHDGDDRDDYDDGEYDDEPEPTGPAPRKLTVTRVAAWRGRQLTQQGIAAFRRAATADGADRSGLTALTYPTMINYGADAAIAVALANTLFFSAATAESKTKVALYLLITVAPFALIAPVVGPLLDRLQRGRRFALAASFVGRAVLAVVMAQHFDDWLLYPAALGAMVLSRSFNLLKAAVTPRVLPPDITLTKTNSRLAIFGLAAGAVIGAVAAGFAALFGSGGALWFTVAVCLAGAWVCLRIPSWVEVTEGEIPASLRNGTVDEPDSESRKRREPLGRHVVVALWGNGTIRVLTGFLTLFVAFVVKEQTEGSAWQQLVLLGMVGAAAGIGSLAGNAVGARQHFTKPDQVILACVSGVLGVAVLATLIGGIATAVLVGLVGAVCSALAKVCLDAVIQNDMSEESRASAFGRTETILQLSWTFGGALGVLLPPTYWIGFGVVSLVLALGTAQTVLTHRGTTLIPHFGGDRPIRSIRFQRPGGRPDTQREPR